MLFFFFMDLGSVPIFPLEVRIMGKEKVEIVYLLPLPVTKVASYLKSIPK